MNARLTLLVVGLVAAALPALAIHASAGGMADEDAQQEFLKIIVGFVRDTDGNIIPEARVVASLKTGKTDLIAQSDAAGHFRIAAFKKSTPDDDILVSCSKEGYQQAAGRRRRSAAGAEDAPVEFDCVLGRL